MRIRLLTSLAMVALAAIACSKTAQDMPGFISIEGYRGEDGADLAVVRFADEATLYRLAGQLEKELPWKDRRPPVWG